MQIIPSQSIKFSACQIDPLRHQVHKRPGYSAVTSNAPLPSIVAPETINSDQHQLPDLGNLQRSAQENLHNIQEPAITIIISIENALRKWNAFVIFSLGCTKLADLRKSVLKPYKWFQTFQSISQKNLRKSRGAP